MSSRSSLPVCLRIGRLFLDTGPTLSIGRFGAYSSYRNIWSNMVKRKEAPVGKKETAPENAEQNEPPVEMNSKRVEELLKMVEELKEANGELNDKYKRALADGENMRIRLSKQIEEAKIFGIQRFCKDLLEVADVLGKATECVPKEEVSDNNPHLKNLYEGLTMTETVLKSVFSRHGLVLVNPINEKFDPNVHEALFEQAVEGKAPGTVVVVSKPGYKLCERVIRPALVGVSK